MEPLERDELSNPELDELLPEWKTPPAPASLRAALFPEANAPWWRTVWNGSIRIPVPAAIAVAALLGIAAWHEIPSPPPSGHELQPVAELRLRIIRSGNAQN